MGSFQPLFIVLLIRNGVAYVNISNALAHQSENLKLHAQSKYPTTIIKPLFLVGDPYPVKFVLDREKKPLKPSTILEVFFSDNIPILKADSYKEYTIHCLVKKSQTMNDLTNAFPKKSKS